MNTPSSESPWIVETSQETFEQDVFQRSQQLPVVVDFWAAWCQPCRLLAPLLEELAEQYQGRFVLVKAETDQVPQAALEFGVQSIPAVYGVVGGDVVDFFTGVLPPQQLRGWLDRLLLGAATVQAKRLEATDPQAAEKQYREIIAQSPQDAAPQIALARLLLEQDRQEECRQLIEQLEERGFLEPEAEKVKAALQLHETSGSVEELRTALQRDPGNLATKFQLAQALAGHEQYEPALRICLELVEQDRQGLGEQARQTMVDIFRVLPEDSELLGTYRRKLSTALY